MGIKLSLSLYLTGLPGIGQSLVILRKEGEYALTVENTGQPRLRFSIVTGGNTVFVNSSSVVVDHRYEVIASLISGQLRLSVDGAETQAAGGGLQAGPKPIGVGANVTEMASGQYSAQGGFLSGNIDDLRIERVFGLRILGVDANGEIGLDANGEATVSIEASSLDPRIDPPNAQAASGTVFSHTLAVHVFKPGDPSYPGYDLPDNIEVANYYFIRELQNLLADTRQKLTLAKYILVKAGLALLSADDFVYLAKLPNQSEIDYVQTTKSLINCAATTLGIAYMGASALGVPVLLMNLPRTKFVLVLAQMYRIGFKTKNFAEFAQFTLFLNWVYNLYRDQLAKVAPSKRDLVRIKDIYER